MSLSVKFVVTLICFALNEGRLISAEITTLPTESATTDEIAITTASTMDSNLTQDSLHPMIRESVVPDVIDAVPPESLYIKYPSGVEAKDGIELTPTQVKDIPSVVSWSSEQGVFHTLCMVDPDAPSKENATFREIQHWLVVNIPGNSIESGKTLSEYIGSGPPQGTGLHRYVFLVYKQPGLLETDEKFISNRTAAGRRNFKIRDFARKYNLENPIAANFYQAQYDDYVPVLRQQFVG